MGNSKFVIDGDIEGASETINLAEQTPENTKKISIGLGVFSIILLVVSFFLFFKVNSFTFKLSEMKGKIEKTEQLKLTNDTLRLRISQLQKENEILTLNSDSLDGIFFEVQIGNFKNFNLDSYNSDLKALHQEKTENSTRIYLGRFRSFSKATLFEKDIEKMGFSDAFIVGRIDGKLVNYQEALAACQKTQGNK